MTAYAFPLNILYVILYRIFFTDCLWTCIIFVWLFGALTGGTINLTASPLKNNKLIKCLFLEDCKVEVNGNIKAVFYNSVFLWVGFN